MAKEQFFYRETQPLFKKLEQLSHRSGVSRGQAFEDLLTAIVCALAAETKEDEYLAMIERHKKGKPGQRGADLMPEIFAELVDAMSRSDSDILGDLFQGSITYGEAGQYFSPESIARMLAELSIDPDARPSDRTPIFVNDPACGTGRMLLEAANVNPYVELVGQDVDARCAKITAINLGLRSRYGWVVCGNSLSGETQFAYRIGSFYHEGPNGRRRGVIRDVPPEQTPVPVLRERLRRDAGDLLDRTDDIEPAPELAFPTIIEVPRWLARIEPQLAALDQGEPPATSEPLNDPIKEPDDRQPHQQELF